ncbi:MAG: hypothetical protein U0531_01850 [Dehalococcoidia bacterium]
MFTLIVTVDVDDTDAVLDTIDRVLELQLDDGLPVHVIPFGLQGISGRIRCRRLPRS